MAKMLPPLGKIVDVVMGVREDKLLILCRDCDEPLMLNVVTVTQASDGSEFSILHNYQCPKCGGFGYASLRNKQ